MHGPFNVYFTLEHTFAKMAYKVIINFDLQPSSYKKTEALAPRVRCIATRFVDTVPGNANSGISLHTAEEAPS